MSRLRIAIALVAAALAALFPAIAAEEPCPAGDLLSLPGATVTPALPGERSEGADPEREAVRVRDPVVVDLGAVRTVRALMVQADRDDVYDVERSADGVAWTPLTVVREAPGDGLRSRAIRLSRPASTRWLRLVPRGGDGDFRLARIAAWCDVPARPPVASDAAPEPDRSFPARSISFAIASLGLVLFCAGVWLGERWRRARDVALLALGLAAGLAWWNFGSFHGGRFVHVWDQFHYFLGGKYFPELGYDGLYECATRADLEDGLAERVRTRQIRDMKTNRRIPASSLADPPPCKKRFRPERWAEFKRDVAWFRTHLPPPLWERVFLDHGYNAPPAWTILGRTLTRWLPVNDATTLALALIDPLLLLLMWCAVVWAFGWRAACVGLLWWGTNRMAYFNWVGGGLLRQDWLALAIVGICLVRRKRPLLGGAALGYAALLRVFPGLLLAAVALQAAARSVRDRRWHVTAAQWRIAAGFAAAVLLLVPLSAATSGGARSWLAFVANSRANYRATGVNMVGWMVVLTYDPDLSREAMHDPADPGWEERWREANRAIFREREPVLWLSLALFAPLLGWVLRDEPEWVALALGIGLIPIAVFVGCYYYGILLGFGLLHRRWGDVVGVVVSALAVATHVGERLWGSAMRMDTRFAWDSAAVVLAVLALVAIASRRRPAARMVGP